MGRSCQVQAAKLVLVLAALCLATGDPRRCAALNCCAGGGGGAAARLSLVWQRPRIAGGLASRAGRLR